MFLALFSPALTYLNVRKSLLSLCFSVLGLGTREAGALGSQLPETAGCCVFAPGSSCQALRAHFGVNCDSLWGQGLSCLCDKGGGMTLQSLLVQGQRVFI